ncbi:MAG: Ig-like domain-containing protein [Gammaproteobacteria bacterium]|nr:Ig-like domain-containing protein [Gammaproteobacteria bacterium]
MDDDFNNSGGITMKWLVFLSAVILLIAGCDSGGDGNVSPERPVVTLSGTAFDGLILDGEVSVYAFDGGIRGDLIGSGTTDQAGLYSLDVQSPNGPIMICISGTDGNSGAHYIEEASDANVFLGQNDELCVVQMYAGEPITSSITYFTNIARGLAEYLISTGMGVEEAINRANTRAGTLLELDILRTTPIDITAIQNATPFTTPGHLYGFATASISQYTMYISEMNSEPSPHDFFNSILFAQKAYEDIRYDGVLNGQAESGMLNMGSISMTTETYRHVLVENMFTIANSTRNLTGLDSSDLFNIGQAWNNSGDTMFGGTPPVALNTTEPTITNISINADQVLSGDAVVFSADVSDVFGLNSVVLQIDNNDLQVFTNGDPVSHTLDTTSYQDGGHTLSIVATNAFNGEFTVDINVTFANRRTTISNINPVDGAYVRGTFNLTADVNDPLGINNTSLYVDDSLHSTATSATSPLFEVNSSAFTDGVHNFRVLATNGVGFDTPSAVNYTVDNTNPTASIPNVANGAYLSGQASIQLDVFDNMQLNRVQLLLNGSALNTYTDFSSPLPPYNFNTTAESDSAATLALSATDSAGNNTVHSLDISIDNNPPTVVIDSPEANSYHSADFDILATITDAIGVETTEYFVDGELQSSNTIALGGVTDGVHSISVAATDFAGHQDSAAVSITVDTTRPAVNITNPVVDSIHTLDLLIAADITDTTPIVSTTYMVDDTVLPTALVNVQPLTDGPHLAKVVAVDSMGFETVAEVSFISDTTPPELSLNLTSGQSISELFDLIPTVSDSLGVESLALFIDGNLHDTIINFTDPISTIFTTSYDDGDHTLRAVATDTSGLTTELIVPFVISNPAPGIADFTFTYVNTTTCRVTGEFSGSLSRISKVEVWRTTVLPGPNQLLGDITTSLSDNASSNAAFDIQTIASTSERDPVFAVGSQIYFRIYNYANDVTFSPAYWMSGSSNNSGRIDCYILPPQDGSVIIP